MCIWSHTVFSGNVVLMCSKNYRQIMVNKKTSIFFQNHKFGLFLRFWNFIFFQNSICARRRNPIRNTHLFFFKTCFFHRLRKVARTMRGLALICWCQNCTFEAMQLQCTLSQHTWAQARAWSTVDAFGSIKIKILL